MPLLAVLREGFVPSPAPEHSSIVYPAQELWKFACPTRRAPSSRCLNPPNQVEKSRGIISKSLSHSRHL